MDLLAQPPFGPDAHAVADNRHPHHQFRINRGPTDAAIERLKLRAHLLKIEKSVDASEQVIIGDMVVEAEIVKQLPAPSESPSSSRSSKINTRMESRQPTPINGRLNQQHRRKAAVRRNVRCWANNGKHMLALTFSAVDPLRHSRLPK
jgi:hypothetical protein